MGSFVAVPGGIEGGGGSPTSVDLDGSGNYAMRQGGGICGTGENRGPPPLP